MNTMSKSQDVVTSDQFFADIMQGCEEASQYLRGETQLRTTRIRIVADSSTDTTVKVSKPKVETRAKVTA